MSALPDHVRITNFGWNENRGAYKVQIGDDSRTVAYAWVPVGIGDDAAREQAFAIAKRLCEGWNA